jgi:hypothetical protein
MWSHSERLHTADQKGIGGWEDWLWCEACQFDLFFPVKHRPACGITKHRVPLFEV